MNLFGLEGSGFIISLGITLLLSGLIMYYCVQRINSLEMSLIKQGEIMQSFIFKINNLESLQHNKINNVCNEFVENNDLTEKIEVSDDDGDNDEDDDIEDDSSDDDINDEDDDGETLYETNKQDLDIKEFNDNNNSDIKNITLVSLSGEISSNLIDNADIKTDSEEDLEHSDDDDEDHDHHDRENNNILLLTSDSKMLNSINDLEIEKKFTDVESEVENVNYNKLKVNELKELAIKKKLVKDNDNTKYKKDELIQLLQK